MTPYQIKIQLCVEALAAISLPVKKWIMPNA